MLFRDNVGSGAELLARRNSGVYNCYKKVRIMFIFSTNASSGIHGFCLIFKIPFISPSVFLLIEKRRSENKINEKSLCHE